MGNAIQFTNMLLPTLDVVYKVLETRCVEESQSKDAVAFMEVYQKTLRTAHDRVPVSCGLENTSYTMCAERQYGDKNTWRSDRNLTVYATNICLSDVFFFDPRPKHNTQGLHDTYNLTETLRVFQTMCPEHSVGAIVQCHQQGYTPTTCTTNVTIIYVRNTHAHHFKLVHHVTEALVRAVSGCMLDRSQMYAYFAPASEKCLSMVDTRRIMPCPGMPTLSSRTDLFWTACGVPNVVGNLYVLQEERDKSKAHQQSDSLESVSLKREINLSDDLLLG